MSHTTTTRTTTQRPLLTSALTLAALAALTFPAAAQDGFAGQYELEGRYSNRRNTQVDLKVTQDGNRFRVERTAKFTSRRYSSLPAFTWSSSETQRSGSLLIVRYELGPDADGMVSRLSPSSSDTAILSRLSEGNVFRAIYVLSSDKRSLREVLYNTTRSGDEDWWRWIKTEGQRKAAPGPGVTAAQAAQKAEDYVRNWYLEDLREGYERDLVGASASERARLIANWNEDKQSGLDTWEGDDFFEGFVDEDYADGSPYRDSHGRVVPRDDLLVITASMFTNRAGIGLSKVFVFDGRTGEYLDESDIRD